MLKPLFLMATLCTPQKEAPLTPQQQYGLAAKEYHDKALACDRVMAHLLDKFEAESNPQKKVEIMAEMVGVLMESNKNREVTILCLLKSIKAHKDMQRCSDEQ